MLFSDIARVDIVVSNNLVILYPKNRIGKNTFAPHALMCAVFMIRHALSFATMHSVLSRAIFDKEERFVCYVLTVEGILSSGGISYLAQVGFGDKLIDLRSQYKLIPGIQKSVREWTWNNRILKMNRKKKKRELL